ncbi:hypothetical protein [Cognatiyoonia koreensis]|nr:hypothetical protein [Cognatiyoonia koreensis]
MSKLSAFSSATTISDPDIVITEAMQSVRTHLGMDVVYISEIKDDAV